MLLADPKFLQMPLSHDQGDDVETAVRSVFHCGGICCSSEVPTIRKIIEQGPYKVGEMHFNVPMKHVIVRHKVTEATAQQLEDLLNDQGFSATVIQDGGAQRQHHVNKEKALCSSMFVFEPANDKDLPAAPFWKDAHRMDSIMSIWFDFNIQVESFAVDSSTDTLMVVHNAHAITAPRIAAILSQQDSKVHVKCVMNGGDYVQGKGDAIQSQDGQGQAPSQESKDMQKTSERVMNYKYPRPTVIASGILWIVSMVSLVGGKPFEYLKWVGLASVAFGLPPIAAKTWRTLKRGQFDDNSLMFFASVGALALGEFAEAAAVVFLFALSEWLEVRATTRARETLKAIVDLRPDKAQVFDPESKELSEVPASSVPVGALVAVRTGDQIPCDGVVVEGESTVDESSLTGESRPIRKGPKDTVAGGTLNSGVTQLMVRTTASAENSTVSRLIRLVEEAQANRSETEKMVDEFAKYYTPVVLVTAILMCTIPWAFGTNAGREWTHTGLILIVVACPCGLIISTPVCYVCGIAATAQNGVLIKGGAYLEALGRTKQVCMDKTGTLTNGEFALLHLKPVDATLFSETKILQYLTLMEERSSHPVAQAILQRACNEGVKVASAMTVKKHTLLPGEGVSGLIDEKEVFVGNERLFERVGLLSLLPNSLKEEVDSWKQLGGTIGFMSVDGVIVCAFCAADGVRSESAAVVKHLKDKGISITMLTGDNHDAALAVGQQVGLADDEIKSKLLPEDKLEHIQSLIEAPAKEDGDQNGARLPSLFGCGKQRKIVLFCGDGVNDAPALAAANVGVAMGAGASLAMETADVTLLDSNLEKLEYSMSLGRRVIQKIWENVIFSIAVKLVVLVFAVMGTTRLWAAIASDVGAMILVTLNAMTILPRPGRGSLGELNVKDPNPVVSGSTQSMHSASMNHEV